MLYMSSYGASPNEINLVRGFTVQQKIPDQQRLSSDGEGVYTVEKDDKNEMDLIRSFIVHEINSPEQKHHEIEPVIDYDLDYTLPVPMMNQEDKNLRKKDNTESHKNNKCCCNECTISFVRQNYHNLQCVCNKMKSDKSFMLNILSGGGNYNALQYADTLLKSDYDFMKNASITNYNALQYANDTLLANSKFI